MHDFKDAALPDERTTLRRGAVALTLMLWAFHYAILTFRGGISFFPGQTDLAMRRLVWTAFGLLLCTLIYFVLERLQHRPFWKQGATAVVIGIPAGILHSAANYFIFFAWSSGSVNAEIPYGVYVDMASYWLWFYLSWATLVLALSYSLRVRQEQRMRAEAQALAHQAQLRVLRYQLNPHFLFNTLNSIAALVLDDRPTVAETMLRKLSAFLRHGLAGDPFDDVTLETEVAQQRLYLDIEQARFPDRLAVRITIPEALQHALVPSFILQPLVENAIKYGVAASLSKTTITISATADSTGMMSITVADDGEGASDAPAGTGIGLRNVSQRLAARFGEQCSFSAKRLSPRGFSVTMTMPLRTATQ